MSHRPSDHFPIFNVTSQTQKKEKPKTFIRFATKKTNLSLIYNFEKYIVTKHYIVFWNNWK